MAQAFLKLLLELQGREEAGVVLSILDQRYGIPLSGETQDPALWLDATSASYLCQHRSHGPATAG